MIIVSKIIDGKEIYYNKETDIISRDGAESGYIRESDTYIRTIPEGIYDTCFEITTKCNQCCRNCFAYSSPENGEEMKYEDIEKIISDRENMRIRIGITGGEPFLHSEIQKVLELPLKFRSLNFMISSNGNFELTNELKKRLVKGKWLISLSIHGDKATHNLYTKSESFDRVISNLSELNEDIIIHTYSVVNRYMTKEDIDYLLDMQNNYRIYYTRFILPRNVGRVDFQYDENLVEYIYEKVRHNVKAGIKKDYSHTELINVKMNSRIIG